MKNKSTEPGDDRVRGDIWRDWDGDPGMGASKETPTLFAALTVVCYLAFSTVAAAVFYMVSPRLQAWHPALNHFARALLSLIIAGPGLAIFLGIVSVVIGRDLLAFIPFTWRQSLLVALFPFCRRAGRALGCSRDAVSASFISCNNRFILGQAHRIEKRSLLVLLPRCLQSESCEQRVIEDVKLCRRCGRCDLSHLVDLMDRYNFPMAVVTGGRLASKLVREFKPRAVIAVACERELIEGLQAVARIPVLGIINKRPEGPCRNTGIDFEKFEAALKSFLLSKTA